MKSFLFSALLVVTVVFLSVSGTHVQAQESNSTNGTIPANLSENFTRQGITSFDQGNYTEAISYYDAAIKLNSTNTNAIYNKALALDQLGLLDDAMANYDQVLKILPNDTDSLYNIAYDLDSLGRYNESISYYDKVLAITPDDADALNNKGIDLARLGHPKDAITYYEKVLAINPEDTTALYNEGVALQTLGNSSEAITDFHRVLDIDPSNVGALNKLNLTYNNINKTQIGIIQNVDKTSLYVVLGLFVALSCAIIIIDRISKNRRNSDLQVTQVVDLKNEGTKTDLQDTKGT